MVSDAALAGRICGDPPGTKLQYMDVSEAGCLDMPVFPAWDGGHGGNHIS
ncbi:hypothetical protein INQ13_22210 [Escherichia coli]|jgi:hypothetical protein|nr:MULTISPECIES: hypothetical protein [Enterobacteriaceae]MBL5946145.1 hypothetical protein [Enterobacter asburiae]MBL7309138.1 hypothetical protein [Escherichia coli]